MDATAANIKGLKMLAFIIMAILILSAGCTSAPILAKNCVKAEGTDVFICKKY